ncbi:hypothetical protein [Hahella ganghwensis]|uniref:hypothetical protein n=1 Tax=Hahella ganghwensis TaxID=286420 RepID=UPI0012F83109|nr:hypothetical protein [Hahella ganghwensis]
MPTIIATALVTHTPPVVVIHSPVTIKPIDAITHIKSPIEKYNINAFGGKRTLEAQSRWRPLTINRIPRIIMNNWGAADAPPKKFATASG